MRSLAIMWLPFVLFASSLDAGPESQDPYWISLVSSELKVNSGGQRIISSWSQKRLVQMGDRVSVSILKILELADLKDAQKARSCLPIIRDAFTQPELISLEVDRDPKVTLFLLNYFRTEISDPQLQVEVGKTVEFVKQKTTK